MTKQKYLSDDIKYKIDLFFKDPCIELCVDDSLARDVYHNLMSKPKYNDKESIEMNIKSDKITILWIGRNSIEKSPSIMMQVANNVQDIIFIMNIPGNSSDNLYMLGKVSNEKLEELYNDCDMFCHTGLWHEPCGLTLIEAQSHGKPILALSNGAIPEYTTEKGRIITDGDYNNAVQNLVQILNDLLKLDNPKDTLKKMGNEAKKFVEENFTYQKMGENYLNLYKKLINQDDEK